jgi:hypothetical protein
MKKTIGILSLLTLFTIKTNASNIEINTKDTTNIKILISQTDDMKFDLSKYRLKDNNVFEEEEDNIYWRIRKISKDWFNGSY